MLMSKVIILEIIQNYWWYIPGMSIQEERLQSLLLANFKHHWHFKKSKEIARLVASNS